MEIEANIFWAGKIKRFIFAVVLTEMGGNCLNLDVKTINGEIAQLVRARHS